jgi:hypothetical protein
MHRQTPIYERESPSSEVSDVADTTSLVARLHAPAQSNTGRPQTHAATSLPRHDCRP